MIGQAACRDEDPELFFPVGDSAPARAQTAAAEAVCHHARVKFDCLTWALKASKDAALRRQPGYGATCRISKNSR